MYRQYKYGWVVLVTGPGSVVSISTGYGLEGAGIKSRWGMRFSAPVQTGPGTHPASSTMGTWSFPGVKSGRGVTLTTHPLLVPSARKIRAIPLPNLWAIRPVQSLSACTRVHFTLMLVKCELEPVRLTEPRSFTGKLQVTSSAQ